MYESDTIEEFYFALLTIVLFLYIIYILNQYLNYLK